MKIENPFPSSLGLHRNHSSSQSRVYLDHNATTAPASQVREKLLEWIDQWGNPSSIHWAGRGSKALMRDARRSLALGINCEPLEIVFTSGGSEANSLALLGFESSRRQVIVSTVEHPSVIKNALWLRAQGYKVDFVCVSREGEFNFAELENLVSDQTALISVMYANNETGNIFPIQKIASLAKAKGTLLHCDAVQALGKSEIDLKSWGVDFASFSAHKFFGLKGAGALYIKRGLNLRPLIRGGGQERGRRAGTENILAIAAFGEMAKTLSQTSVAVEKMRQLRDAMEARILREITNVKVTGSAHERISNTSSLIIDGVDGETLLMNLDLKGYCVSTGAACSSGNPEPSPVLLAMGLTRLEAQSSLRLSIGWQTTQEELDVFVEILKEVVNRLRSFKHGEKAHLGL